MVINISLTLARTVEEDYFWSASNFVFSQWSLPDKKKTQEVLPLCIYRRKKRFDL